MKPLALAAAVAVLASAARADDVDVRYHLALHARYSDLRDQPAPVVRYDRAARAFDVAPYLRPATADGFGSGLLSAGADGRAGWLRWALAADTGEVRGASFPRGVSVCASTLVPSGVDLAGGGRCNVLVNGRRPQFRVDETRLAPGEVTSNARPIGEEARTTLFVREAWLGAAFGRNDLGRVAVGRKRFTVGDGFVYDDYGTGIDASFDLGAVGPSWDLGASVFYPTREFPRASAVLSPMVALRADYLPSLFEHAGLFLALFRDRSDSLAELFRGSSVEPEVVRLQAGAPGTAAYQADEQTLATVLGSTLTSEGTLSWLGTSGSVRAPAQVRLEWTGALVVGNADIRRGAAARGPAGDVLGELAHLRVRRPVDASLEVGGFLLFLSGDLPPAERQRLGLPRRYGGFLGIAPFVTATNIFFNGGVAETFASRQATAPGVNGRGVLVPGLTAAWDPSRALGLDARAAYLVAPEVGPYGGRVYGPEVDLVATWSPRPWIAFVAEGDALFPGDFFKGRATVTKVVLGVDLVAM